MLSLVQKEMYQILKEEIIEKNEKEERKFYSVRALAIKYKKSTNLILKVMQKLKNEGWVYPEKGRGYFLRSSCKKGIKFECFENSRDVLDFASGRLISYEEDIKLFQLYENAIRKILNKGDINCLYKQNIQGISSLRDEISKNLKKRDIFVTEEEIIVSSNLQSAISTVLYSFLEKGKATVAISNPNSLGHLAMMKDLFNIKSFDLKNGGWNMKEFEEYLKNNRVDLVYITPIFQNPTGLTWSGGKKRKLLVLAKKYNFYILEKDNYSEFYYDRRERALKSMDKNENERVIYIKAFEKLTFTDLRIAIIVPPKQIKDKILSMKYNVDNNTSGIKQKVFEYLLQEKRLVNYFKNIRKILKEKYELTVRLLEDIEGIEITKKSKGGFFLLVNLPIDVEVEEFCRECEKKGVRVVPSKYFYLDRIENNAIRISFVTLSLEEIKNGIEIMKSIITEKLIKVKN